MQKIITGSLLVATNNFIDKHERSLNDQAHQNYKMKSSTANQLANKNFFSEV